MLLKKVDPRTKIFIFLVISIASLLYDNLIFLLFLLFIAIITFILGKANILTIIKRVLPFFIVIIPLFIALALFAPTRRLTPTFLGLYEERIEVAEIYGLRILIIVLILQILFFSPLFDYMIAFVKMKIPVKAAEAICLLFCPKKKAQERLAIKNFDISVKYKKPRMRKYDYILIAMYLFAIVFAAVISWAVLLFSVVIMN
jgi:energy-coupling factor transporter transmembrane protein EcfT